MSTAGESGFVEPPDAPEPDVPAPAVAGIPVKPKPKGKGRPRDEPAPTAAAPKPKGKGRPAAPSAPPKPEPKPTPAPRPAAAAQKPRSSFVPESTGRTLRYPAAVVDGRVAAACRRPVDWMKHLSDTTRAGAVLLLHTNGEMAVNEICAGLDGMSQPAISHHLALLRHSRLIEPRRQGKSNYYGLTPTGTRLAEILASLMA
jgi:DNA-binding transcriptional ArsR family regulator